MGYFNKFAKKKKKLTYTNHSRVYVPSEEREEPYSCSRHIYPSILECKKKKKSHFKFSQLNFICILGPSSHLAPSACLILLAVEARSVKPASPSSPVSPGLCLSFRALAPARVELGRADPDPGDVPREGPVLIGLW